MQAICTQEPRHARNSRADREMQLVVLPFAFYWTIYQYTWPQLVAT